MSDCTVIEKPTPVYVWDGRRWRPGEWLRTVERGQRTGWYVVCIGYERRERQVPPDAVRERR